MFQAPATITINRTSAYPDRLRNYTIFVDDKIVGRVWAEGSIEIPVTPGNHIIAIKIDWCGSNKLPFSIREGESLHFECSSNLMGLRFFLAPIYIIFMRNQYLWIKKA
jgi:hypothetical protein